MQRLLFAVDRVSTRVGQAAAWLIVALTAIVAWEVGSRYVFGAPHAWAFDAQVMLYGSLFMLAGGYTLAKSGHVRGDILYGFLPARGQAAIDLTLYLGFLVPGVVAMVWAGYTFAADSWAIDEHSSIMAEGPPIYPFKTVIPVAGALVLLQALAEIVRCVACLARGAWPPREEDVEEVDVDELREMVGRREEPRP
jgi:TRAP-type mannitol/chloroaromatic compound transport system permease small subunit